MIYNNIPNFPLINNNLYQSYINQNIIYNVYNIQYLIKQRNNFCQFHQNNFLQNYQNSFLNQEKNNNSKMLILIIMFKVKKDLLLKMNY